MVTTAKEDSATSRQEAQSTGTSWGVCLEHSLRQV